MILHLWYSAMLTIEMVVVLHAVFLPCITEVCNTIRGKSQGSVHAKTFRIDQSSVQLTLKKCEWYELIRMFGLPNGLTAQEAQSLRRAVTLPWGFHCPKSVSRSISTKHLNITNLVEDFLPKAFVANDGQCRPTRGLVSGRLHWVCSGCEERRLRCPPLLLTGCAPEVLHPRPLLPILVPTILSEHSRVVSPTEVYG